MTHPRNNRRQPGGRKPLAWMPEFLAELRTSGNIRQAARTAKIAQTTAYDARHRHAHFRRAWDEALAAAQDSGGLVGELCAATTVPAMAADPLPARSKSASAHWRNHFFDALAESSSVKAAAAHAGVKLRTVYRLRRDDGEFAARWLAALHEGYDNLEMELLGYLRDAQPKRKMDVAAALRLLAAHRDTVERRRALVEEESEQETLDSIDRFIEEMRQRRAANEAILAETAPDKAAEPEAEAQPEEKAEAANGAD